MPDLTPSGYLGIDDAIAAFCERMYRNEPETDLVQALRDSGLSIGSADRPADAIEALRRAVIRGSLEVFVWHSGMSATVKLSNTGLARLRMWIGDVIPPDGPRSNGRPCRCLHIGRTCQELFGLTMFFEEHAFRSWLDRRERRRRSSPDGNIARPVALGRPSKIQNHRTDDCRARRERSLGSLAALEPCSELSQPAAEFRSRLRGYSSKSHGRSFQRDPGWTI